MKRLRLLAGVVIVLAIPSIVSAAGMSASTYADVVRADSPNGYWRLGEDIGATTAADASGHGHTGSYGWRITQQVGGALASDSDAAAQFPGDATGLTPKQPFGNNVAVTDAPDLRFPGDFTVEAWVQPTLLMTPGADGASGGERVLAAKASAAVPPGCVSLQTTPSSSRPKDLGGPGWSISVTDDSEDVGQIRATIAYAATTTASGCPLVQQRFAYGPGIRVDDGNWHYVAVVFHRSSDITVYVDGIAQTTPGASLPDSGTGAALTIGSLGGIYPFQGNIDEAAVYDHALTAAQLEVHRQAGLAAGPAEPITPAADGTDTPGIVQLHGTTSSWSLSNTLDGTVAQSFTSFCCGQVVIGDWDGDGIDSGAFFDNGHWTFNDGYDTYVDQTLDFGQAGDVAVAGDWNGDGIDTPGYRRGSTWYLSDTFAGSIDYVVTLGSPTDVPVVGDWDGDGRDGIGVFNGTTWQLSNTLDGAVVTTVSFGQPGDTPLAGDWNGDGRDTIGVRRGTTWYLSDGLSGSIDHQFDFGAATDTPVVGDWDNDVVDSTENVDTTAFSSLQHSVASAVAPAVVRSLAPVVWLNEDPVNRTDWLNPARASLYFIHRAALKWQHPSPPHATVRGRGRVKAFRLGAASGAGAYSFNSTDNARVAVTTYRANQFTRPYESNADRHDLVSNAGFYLDLLPNADSARHGEADVSTVPSYYDYRPGRWIRYWFFYAYDFGGEGFNHEGDWEGITIHLDQNNKPLEVRLDRHSASCGVTHKWSEMNVDPATGHIVVYAAHGDHATYNGAGSDGPNQCHPFLTDLMAQTEKWMTWNVLGNVRSQDWYGFGGAWGEPGTVVQTTGPLGPSRWKLGVPDGW